MIKENNKIDVLCYVLESINSVLNLCLRYIPKDINFQNKIYVLRYASKLLPLFVGFLLMAGCTSEQNNSENQTQPQNFKIAFFGDQGLNENSRAVLELIKDEHANMVLHLGDFEYHDNPDAWEKQIDEILGKDFPYFAVIGNHDLAAWNGYQQKLEERLQRIPNAHCTGDIGVKSACEYKGIFFLLSGVGTLGTNHEEYIREQLAITSAIWRICAWHKNHLLMQVGVKRDEVGWDVYEECRKAGAIIATAHEHSYSRTHLMSDFLHQTIASQSNQLNISQGKTFVFVSGLGGESIRPQNTELASKKWWAKVYTATQNANYGALFCTFNVDGQNNLARCYFKDIEKRVVDEFEIVRN